MVILATLGSGLKQFTTAVTTQAGQPGTRSLVSKGEFTGAPNVKRVPQVWLAILPNSRGNPFNLGVSMRTDDTSDVLINVWIRWPWEERIAITEIVAGVLNKERFVVLEGFDVEYYDSIGVIDYLIAIPADAVDIFLARFRALGFEAEMESDEQLAAWPGRFK